MLRRATVHDIPAIRHVRASVVENILSDPSKVTDEDYLWFVQNPGLFVWDEGGSILGFSAADPRNSGIWALFVLPDFEKRGIGRQLLQQSCDALRTHGITHAWLTTDPGTRAEEFYRRAGWDMTGTKDGELLFEIVL